MEGGLEDQVVHPQVAGGQIEKGEVLPEGGLEQRDACAADPAAPQRDQLPMDRVSFGPDPAVGGLVEAFAGEQRR
ncbi:hypothetical protein [Streptomyces sp. F001]|uniref:hypothetical protein n=1 Tax=Streptomyces sp. F001 TaxID=1510026 RepID=UPI0013EE962B|nr:hypothetical protein [Streptomyces sp. F001]